MRVKRGTEGIFSMQNQNDKETEKRGLLKRKLDILFFPVEK